MRDPNLFRKGYLEICIPTLADREIIFQTGIKSHPGQDRKYY